MHSLRRHHSITSEFPMRVCARTYRLNRTLFIPTRIFRLSLYFTRIHPRRRGGRWRPACFLSLRTTQHDFWSATQRGADYAEAFETCRCAYLGGICIRTGSGTGSVQIPLLVDFGTRHLGYCDRYLRQSGPKKGPNVCASV